MLYNCGLGRVTAKMSIYEFTIYLKNQVTTNSCIYHGATFTHCSPTPHP